MKKQRRGVTSLALAVLTAFVLFGLGLVVSLVSGYTIAGERRMEATIRARYLAEAGLALAYAELQQGGQSFQDERKLFAGKLRVQTHRARDIPSGKDCIDILSQGVVQEQGVLLYARVVVGATFFSTADGKSAAQNNKQKLFYLHQFAVPKKALGKMAIANKHAIGPGAHTLIDTFFQEQRDKALKLYRQDLAKMGRRGVHRFCRDAIAVITGTVEP